MRVRILRPVAGYGTFVQGSPRLFSLQVGDPAEIEDQIARQWIAGGIAAAVEDQPMQTPQRPAPESAMTRPGTSPERQKPQPRPHRGRRN